jgi:hypothetical protein
LHDDFRLHQQDLELAVEGSLHRLGRLVDVQQRLFQRVQIGPDCGLDVVRIVGRRQVSQATIQQQHGEFGLARAIQQAPATGGLSQLL